MGHFQAIEPSELLAPYVRQYWFLTVDDLKDGSQRFMPGGSIGIIFNRGEAIYSSLENDFLPQSYIFGQASAYTDLIFNSLNLIIVVFRPVGAKVLLKMPVNELNGQSIPIDVLGDFHILELEQRLMNTIDNKTCVCLIEQFLLKRIYKFEEYNFKRLTSVVNSIYSGENDISKLAQTACLGYKQFKRIFVEYIGLNPKDFLRVNRFSKTVHLLQTQSSLSLSELAYECDYYDKSHLIKEIKRYSGYSPAEFLSNCDVYSDYMSLFQSFFINRNY